MYIPEEIIQLIYMYSLPSIFHDYPTLLQEMKEAIAKRNTYAHRVYRCKTIAKLYIKKYEQSKIQKLLSR